jgi:E3 ubiquitin-protein ligase SHPRH
MAFAMAEMGLCDEPAAKRRKVSTETSDYRSDIAQHYIAIAKASLDVEVVPGEPWEGLRSLASRSPVNLKAVTNRFKLTTLNKKALPDMQRSASTPYDANAIRIFEDAHKLESLWKYSSNISALPLTCTRANLSSTKDESHKNQNTYRLEVEILWYNAIIAQDKVTELAVGLLNRYQGRNASVCTDPILETWSPRDFYDNIHVPEKTAQASAKIKIDLLQCQLYPFQRRAVRWLLEKEGVQVEPSGQVSPLREVSDHEMIPDSFRKSVDADGHECFVSDTFGVVSDNLAQLQARYCGVKGGILAEEMGLGKTVEMIALMCLHRRQHLSPHTISENRSLKTSGATLIITPVPILEQWKQEILEHAPSLKVYQYDGLRTSARRKSDSELIDLLATQDVVLTTYNVVAREIHYVAERPDRNLRHKAKFDPPKSPLTQISWWRVCLDEAQMIESGVSAAAQVARLIPRENAWAVSGTPLKKDHKDLFGLLLFLKYEPWCQSLRIWNRLLSNHKSLFRNMLRKTAIRHSKDMVREDLRLPPQSRHTITVPFTAIEEQHYAQLFHEMCEECGLNRDGAPLTEEWDPESSAIIERLRTWLTRLRQTCLHPEVGGRNRRALGRSGGPLRSVLQVLEVMIDQNDTLVRAEQRLVLLSQIRRGQMLENAKQSNEAMEIWLDAYKQSSAIVDECREQLQTEIELHRKQEDSLVEVSKSDEDDDTGEIETRLTAHRQRLRSALEVKHTCIFFLGNVYFQMKTNETTVKPDSEEFKDWERREEAAYEEAKSIRSELLSEVVRKANRAIEKVRTKAKDETFVAIPEMQLSLDYGGIESRKVFDKLHHYCEALNKQARQLAQLRDKVMDFLRQSLIDEDEGVELQGDEYEASTKHQDEMYAYMEALRALYADRSDALTGQTNTLIAHEVKVALRAAKAGEGPAPEVLISLMAEREKNRVPIDLGSLRGIITEVRHLITALQWQEGAGSTRARAELVIANGILQLTQQMSTSQTKTITALEQEVGLFRETMNNRLDYYRALQKISDTVAPYEEENQGKPLDKMASARLLAEEEQKSKKISSLLSKRRYLAHLRTEQDSSMQTQRICTICQSDFENGTLTVCGHQFCKDCIRLWWSEHRTCPVCKRHLRSTDFYDITYKPAEMAIQEETSPARFDSPGSSERSVNRSIYSDVSNDTLNQIKNIDLDGSYFGTKVDTICRHLYWLREHDPGSKAIIFSQYREFLDVLGRAFGQYKIAFSRFDDRNGIEKFKSDPAVECFLLHAKAHSTGLNLVVASHVFLCEPLINTAIELQAIARVHRIGQHRPTTVWMYLVADTVEESIYDISVTRRLAHIKRATKPATSRSGTATPIGIMESTIDAANSLELQTADLSKLLTSGKSGGELVDNDDLWTCLFGRVKKRDAGFSAAAEAADGEVGRFLRAEAAEGRRTQI